MVKTHEFQSPEPLLPTGQPPERIDHPPHYQGGGGIEAIEILKHHDFVVGNILKYAMRCGQKDGVSRLEDLKKCLWYVNFAIQEEEAASR